MIRRQPIQEDDENPDRWLVSYADFITLLFAFFVVMYAVSSVNLSKYQALSSSINSAFTNQPPPLAKNSPPNVVKSAHQKIAPATTQPPAKDKTINPPEQQEFAQLQQERARMQALGKTLASNLAPLIGEGKVHISQNNRGLRIDINDSVLFASGSAQLAGTAKAVLNEIATLLLENHHAIQVEGHTDNTPIHNALFYSNWELSAVRASSVVRMFSSMGIIDTRLSALGFGSSQPVSDNTTEAGRAKNRHVSIMVLYDSLTLNHENDVNNHQDFH